MQCLRCRYENLPDAMFCEDCGMKFGRLCPQCRADNRVTSKFCRKCGATLTGQPAASSSTPAEKPQTAQENQAVQVEQVQAEQSMPEAEPRQLMKVVYPRCCGLHVQKREVEVCLRLCDADGQVHKEVRTFGTQTWELLVLSDWLVTHGVTHAAIAETGVYWPRVYRVLEHNLTVRLIKDIQDVQVIADLLAHGLVQDDIIPSRTLRKLPGHSKPTLAAVIAVIVAALLTTHWLWKQPNTAVSEQLPMELPPRMVWWQQSQVSYQHPAGTQFTVPLPNLERSSDGLPFEVTLDSSGDWPSWLQLDPEGLRISGIAPMTAEDRTYDLIFDAKAENGGESRLQVSLTITGQSEPKARQNFLAPHHSW